MLKHKEKVLQSLFCFFFPHEYRGSQTPSLFFACFGEHTLTHFLINLLLFFILILDLSWVQQSSSPSTYYQSASSLTFTEEEDKKRGTAKQWERKRRIGYFSFSCETTMNHRGRFGLSEKYRFCHVVCNYCPDYHHSKLFQWPLLQLKLLVLEKRDHV